MAFEIRKQNGKYAIFKDGIQITDWFDDIYDDGLVKDESNYFAAEKDGYWNIYEYKDGNVIRITDGFDNLNTYGLISGTSNYFLAGSNDKVAIYEYKDGKVRKITEDFDWIYGYELVWGQSNYFVAAKNRKSAIYEYKNGKVNKITDDFDYIYEYGLIDCKSNFYGVEVIDTNREHRIYHRLLDRIITKTVLFWDKQIYEYQQNKNLSNLPLLDGEC